MIADIHRKRAERAYCEAIQAAETKLTRQTALSDKTEQAKNYMDVAELYILACDTKRAEAEYRKALDIFLLQENEKEEECLGYVVYILKALCGIHKCQGRKYEAEAELKDAMKLEEQQLTFKKKEENV